jgi:hypothetical protein
VAAGEGGEGEHFGLRLIHQRPDLGERGGELVNLALPYAKVACNRLKHSLGDRRVEIITHRRQIQLLSNSLQSLLPKL